MIQFLSLLFSCLSLSLSLHLTSFHTLAGMSWWLNCGVSEIEFGPETRAIVKVNFFKFYCRVQNMKLIFLFVLFLLLYQGLGVFLIKFFHLITLIICFKTSSLGNNSIIIFSSSSSSFSAVKCEMWRNKENNRKPIWSFALSKDNECLIKI